MRISRGFAILMRHLMLTMDVATVKLVVNIKIIVNERMNVKNLKNFHLGGGGGKTPRIAVYRKASNILCVCVCLQ